MNDKQAEQMMDDMSDYQQGIADRLQAGKRLASWDEVPSSAYETHSEFVEHYKNVQKLSIEMFKKKYPNGATITDGKFLGLNNKGE